MQQSQSSDQVTYATKYDINIILMQMEYMTNNMKSMLDKQENKTEHRFNQMDARFNKLESEFSTMNLKVWALCTGVGGILGCVLKLVFGL